MIKKKSIFYYFMIRLQEVLQEGLWITLVNNTIVRFVYFNVATLMPTRLCINKCVIELCFGTFREKWLFIIR